MNIAYKVKAVIEGFLTIDKNGGLNAIYCFLHPFKTYAYERDWFLDLYNDNDSRIREYLKWHCFGWIPQALVYGLFGLLIEKLKR